jgi:DNA-binding PadR family transcriptional regulator
VQVDTRCRGAYADFALVMWGTRQRWGLDKAKRNREYYIQKCTSMPLSDQPTPDDLTPLSPAFFHILLSLGAGERHGYAIRREVAARTEGKLKLGPGVLYGSINKMVEMGLIEESGDRPDAHLDDERRRYYRITDYGRTVAQAEAARMREMVRLAAATFGAPRHA